MQTTWNGEELVPCERIRPILEEYLSYPDNTRRSLSSLTGVPERRIYAILSGSQENVSFQTVDRLLTGLGLVHVWHVDLKDVYRAA